MRMVRPGNREVSSTLAFEVFFHALNFYLRFPVLFIQAGLYLEGMNV